MSINSIGSFTGWQLEAHNAAATARVSGPPLLHLDRGWTPQGQGYDKKRDELLTTYYFDDRPSTKINDSKLRRDGEPRGVLLSVQDRQNGDETGRVILLGKGQGPAPAHGGGVSTDGKYVYVADTKETYVYSREDIDNARRNPDTGRKEVEALHVIKTPRLSERAAEKLVSSASYLTVRDGYAYVGAYSKEGDGKTGAVWRYKINDDGSFAKNPEGPIKAPDRAQGVTVVNGGRGLLFSTGERKLVYQPITSSGQAFDTDGRRVRVDNDKLDGWAQGINVIDGKLYVTYESGSWQYDGERGRQRIQVIPLNQLDDFPA